MLCLLCSCSAHLYSTLNYNISETQVVLDKANFDVVGNIDGCARATYFLGIGGMSQKSLKGNAVADMYKKANLTGSQAIINTTFKKRVSNVLLVYSQIEYTASGIIIEFYDGERPIQASKASTNQIGERPIQASKTLTNQISDTMIISQKETNGTWYDGIEYCKTLGEGWTLPNKDHIDYICDNFDLKFSNCWTNIEVNEKKAKAYYRGYTIPSMNTLKSTNNIGIIAVKVVHNEAIE